MRISFNIWPKSEYRFVEKYIVWKNVFDWVFDIYFSYIRQFRWFPWEKRNVVIWPKSDYRLICGPNPNMKEVIFNLDPQVCYLCFWSLIFSMRTTKFLCEFFRAKYSRVLLYFRLYLQMLTFLRCTIACAWWVHILLDHDSFMKQCPNNILVGLWVSYHSYRPLCEYIKNDDIAKLTKYWPTNEINPKSEYRQIWSQKHN